MATQQLATLPRLQRPQKTQSSTPTPSLCGETATKCSGQVRVHHYESGSDDPQKARGKSFRRSWRSQSHWSRELPRLGFWYSAASIRYILKKAKAFYNECCCDAFDDADETVVVVKDDEVGVAALVDPYFSIPVIPPN